MEAGIWEAGILAGWFVDDEIFEDGIQKDVILDTENLVADILEDEILAGWFL